ncbi:MAG: tRNA 2-thiouridine(34) synthase MnmA [Pirellulales bacterium]|nr:tRNA 2-thiouridine(34) synthase MnmA [Pirellulales bacterium]
MARVVLAMSGGVDSSVAAWLLREQGYDVVGVFMLHGQERRTRCQPVTQDVADARRVADLLGIPFQTVDFRRDFDQIVDYFVGEYAAGRTPNPCIVCNARLKFGKLFDVADEIGAEYVATGHHARLTPLAAKGDSPNLPERSEGRCAQVGTVPFCHNIALCRGRDQSKDQSYALFGIRKQLLSRLIFPVGEHRKEEIRRIAERLGLRVAAKRDSQEICFIPPREHARFVRQRLGNVDTSGEIVATDGTPLGRHDGIERFTVGQRKGLRLAFGEPKYVVRIEADSRRVVIGARDELARRELTASGANWLAEGPAALAAGENAISFRAQVKIRYRSRPAEAAVERLPGGRFSVRFDGPCFGVAPGQAAVCYDGERVLGGGWIE